MKIVLIPSGFKECLGAEDVALAMDKGIRRVDPNADTVIIPMIDGGEGFAKTIVEIKKGRLVQTITTGPVGKKIMSHFGVYEEDGIVTAVIEMAAVAGLKLVPRHLRNPLVTTTYGIGELIKAALDLNVDRILIGCGDSGTSDGGAGMAQALGVRFLDQNHQTLEVNGGGDLCRVASVDLSRLDQRLKHVRIDAACNWHTPLCGTKGAAYIFGPQKGACPEDVELLATGFERYALLIQGAAGMNVRDMPGSGASGGLGAGLAAFAGAHLNPRYDIIMKYINIEEHIRNADVVLTAEGCLDYQTPYGKIPAEVARIAKLSGVPVVAMTGTIGKGADINYTNGIDAYMSIIQKPATLEVAMEKAAVWIADCAETTLRQMKIGYQIAERIYKRELA